MYNKKILLEALKNLDKAKAPAKKKDIPFDPTGKGMLNPMYAGKPVVLPTDTVYNPTPYKLKATSDNGIQQILNPFDETNVHFPGASSIKEEPIMKKGGSKKFSKNLLATNKLMKKNPLLKKKSYKGKTYDPSAMYFQDGGGIPYAFNPYVSAEAPMDYIPFVNPIITGTEPEDYQQFLDYSRTAPENRRPNENYFYGNPDDYDHYGMWDALGKPKDFQQALETNPDWEPDPYDDMYHGFSVNPNTGVFLKSGKPEFKPGDTTWMEIAGHYLSPRAQMDTPVFDTDLQRFRYIPNEEYKDLTDEEIEEYRKGGYIVEELPQAQDGLFVPRNLMASATPATTDQIIALGRGPINITPVNTPVKSKTESKPVSKKDEIINVSSQTEYDKYLKLYTEALKLNKEAARVRAANTEQFGKDVRESKWNEKDLEWMPKKDKDKYLRAIKMGLAPTGTAEHTIDGITAYPTYKAVKPYFQEVYDKQQKLVDAGYDIGDVDGIWGKKSKAAWEEFQQKQRPEVFPESIPATETGIETIQPQVVNNSVEVSNTPNEPAGSRSQTIMEPDPRNPGKFRVKEVRTVKYSKSLDPPRVVYYNPETGQEGIERFQDGGLIKAQEGIETSCPEGYSWDGTKCTLTAPDVQNLQEVTYYGNEPKRKLQGDLLDKFQQVKGAYQDWRQDAGLRQASLKSEGASSIEALRAQIEGYKKELEEEKKRYSRAQTALDILKKKRPDEWKDAKLSDVMSSKGIESLRSLYSEGTLTEGAFRDFYNNFGSQYDVNVKKGTGPDKVYSAKEAKQEWMENVPEFVEKVSNFAKAASLLPVAPIIAEGMPAINAALNYAPVQSLPWLTGGNALNAHFAYETFKPEGYVQQAYEGFKEGDLWKGAENTAWSALGALPFVKPAIGTARAINTMKTPGGLGVIPNQGRYSLAYKSPMESGLVVGNPNLGSAAPAFESITNPLSRFTKEAGLGEFKILKQNQTVTNVQPNTFLGEMVNAGQTVKATTPALMENLPQQLPGLPSAISSVDDVGRGLRNENVAGVEGFNVKYNVKGQEARKQFLSDLQNDPDYINFKENATIRDIEGKAHSTFGVPNSVTKDEFKNAGDAYDDIAGITPNEAKLKLSKDDNQITSDIINDLRERKIGLWQTPEGQSRLQKMIDNTPSLKDQTPESLIEGIAKMNNVNAIYGNSLKTRDSLQSQIDNATNANMEGYMSNAEYKSITDNLNDQLEIVNSTIDDIETSFKDFKAFYNSSENAIGITPGLYKESDLSYITSHEIGHFLGSYNSKIGPNYLDEKLAKLKLIDDTSEQLKIPFTEAEESSAYNRFGPGRDGYLEESKNYFLKGSKGSEKVPMASEIREDMLQTGLIKSEYDPITSKMIKDHFYNYKRQTGEKFPLRLYDVMKDDPKNFNLLKEVLNELPMIVGVAAGASEFADSEDSGVTEAGMGALFAALLRRPSTSKIAKNLKDAVQTYKTYGVQALKPGQLKTLNKEIKKLEESNKKMYAELGLTPGEISLKKNVGLPVSPNEKTLLGRHDALLKKVQSKKDKASKFLYKTAEEELLQKVLQKERELGKYDQLKKQFIKGDEGAVSEITPSKFEGVTTTGMQKVTDLSTGQKVNAEVSLPRTGSEYKIVNGELQAVDQTIKNPVISSEYVTALKNSIDKVQTDIPGAKVFGSSVLVTEAGMPHITGDIDLLITQSDYNTHVVGKYDYVREYGPAKQHALYPQYGEEGVLDFNIINENPDGTVKIVWRDDVYNDEQSSLELELFRQFYPEQFQKASLKAITEGKPIEINMPAENFIAGINPEIKTVIDSYEATPLTRYSSYKTSKEKHILRPDVLIAFGKPEVVAKGQEAFVKSLVGPKGKVGHQFSEKGLQDVDKNVLALVTMGFKGDVMAVAQDPKRMQLALNDHYINSTTFSREISKGGLPGQVYTEENIKKALTEWFPGKGGSVHGPGLNTVQLGNPSHAYRWDVPVIGHRQLGIKMDTKDPYEYVKSIRKATSGLYTFTPEEQTVIQDILKKYKASSTSVKQSKDILNLYFPDISDAKPALEEIASQTGIRAIRKDQDPTGVYAQSSYYASILDGFDEALDAMMYSFKDFHAAPKSFYQREKKLSEIENKRSLSRTQLETIEDFKKISSVIDTGYQQAFKRYEELTDMYNTLLDKRKILTEKLVGKETAELDKIADEIEDVRKELNNSKMKIHDLANKARRIREIQNDLAGLGLGLLGAGTVYGITSYINKDIKERREKLKVKVKKLPKMQQGGTPSQVWQQYTGTPWSEARKQGLTDGTASQNIALANRLMAGEFGEAKVSEQQYEDSRTRYNQMIVNLVNEGRTLDELVEQRIGTRVGLLNRFPELFNQVATPKALPNKGSAKKDVQQRTAPVAEPTPQAGVPYEVMQRFKGNPMTNLSELSRFVKGEQKPAAQPVMPSELSRKFTDNPMTNFSELNRFVRNDQKQKPEEAAWTPPNFQAPVGTPPSLSSKRSMQPIAGGLGSQFSNTGRPGEIDQKKLSGTEERVAEFNKEVADLQQYVQPSTWDKISRSQSQLFSTGPDIYKGLDELEKNFDDYGQYIKRLAVKKGLSDVEEEKVVVKKEKPVKPVIEKEKVDKYYNEIATVADRYTKGDSLLSYRNQWDNAEGFEYIATPVKKDRDPSGSYRNVKGVAHFLLDASANPLKPYSHEYNQAYLQKAKENNDWIPTFQTVDGDTGRVRLKYKKPDELTQSDKVYTPLRQMKFSEIRFDKTKKPEGFKSGIKEVTKNDGEGTYLIFKDRDGYSRFSGGSVVFIFKDKAGNTVVRDFAGSLNQIENEGVSIQKQYNIKPEELTIGYHDVGSFSAKPKANTQGELKNSQWDGYNPYDWTGGALLIPND